MDMKKMIEMIEATKVTKEELSISTLHQELVKLYSEKNVAHYTELLKYILSLSVQLNLHLVLKYFWRATDYCCRRAYAISRDI